MSASPFVLALSVPAAGGATAGRRGAAPGGRPTGWGPTRSRGPPRRALTEADHAEILAQLPDTDDLRLARACEDWGYLIRQTPAYRAAADRALADFLGPGPRGRDAAATTAVDAGDEDAEAAADGDADAPPMRSSWGAFEARARALAAATGWSLEEARTWDALRSALHLRQDDVCRYAVDVEQYARHAALPPYVRHHAFHCTSCATLLYLARRRAGFAVDPARTADVVGVPPLDWAAQRDARYAALLEAREAQGATADDADPASHADDVDATDDAGATSASGSRG